MCPTAISIHSGLGQHLLPAYTALDPLRWYGEGNWSSVELYRFGGSIPLRVNHTHDDTYTYITTAESNASRATHVNYVRTTIRLFGECLVENLGTHAL